MDYFLSIDIETVCDVKDCEGYGGSTKCKHALDHNRNRITCIGVTDDNNIHRVFRDISSFNSYIESEHPTTPITGHNFKFDCKSLLAHNATDKVFHNWKFDSQLALHTSTRKISNKYLTWYEEQRRVFNKKLPQGVSHRPASHTSLKTNAPYWLEVDPFWEDPANHDNDEYVLKDCVYTHRLTKMFHHFLKEDEEYEFYETRMMPFAKMLLQSELRGVPFSVPRAQDMKKELNKRLLLKQSRMRDQWFEAQQVYTKIEHDALKQEYHNKCLAAIRRLKDKSKIRGTKDRYQNLYRKRIEKTDTTLNFDSPKQMLWLLEEHLKYDCSYEGYDSELGRYTTKHGTGVEVLQKLAKEGKEDVKVLKEYREAQKLIGYIDSLVEKEYNGRIYCSYNLCGTKTGRLSCSEPNLQQMNSALYPLFHSENSMLVCYDLSGIEAMLIALYSNDPELYKILSKGESLHDHNTKDWFGFKDEIKEIKSNYPKERQCSKTVGFSLFYGAGKKRLSTTLTSEGFKFTKEEIAGMHQRFQKRFKGAIAYHKQLTRHFEFGKKLYGIAGRPVKIQDPADAYMKGFNRAIQGSASDLNLLAAKNYTDKENPGYPVLFVHDMIGIEVMTEEAEQAEKALIEEMTKFNLECKHGKLELQVEGGKGHEWQK